MPDLVGSGEKRLRSTREFGHTPSRIQQFNGTCAVSLERVKLVWCTDRSWQVPSHGRQKCPQKGRGQGTAGAEFLNFKPPSVNLERVKLETSNSVYGYTLASSFVSSMTITPKGRGQGPVTKKLNFKPLP